MKIGILTFHRAINYGAVLQCFALQKVLQSYGHSVEIIDYRPECIEFYRKFFSFERHKRTGNNLLKDILLSIYTWPAKRKANRSFNKFISTYLKVSKNKVKKIDSFSQDYDLIVIGSDQVFNPKITWGYDLMYWGDFKRNSQTKLISYAASVKNPSVDYSKNDYAKINRLLSSFDAVSVRELSLKVFLERNCQIDSVVTLDPTLLLVKEDYNLIAEAVQEKNYIFLYSLDYKSGAFQLAQKMASQLGYKILCFSATRAPAMDNVINVVGGSVSEFVGYIKNAKLAIVSSFHGTVLSIINKVDFYSVCTAGGDRERNILVALGLGDRLVNSTDNIVFKSIDYRDIDEKMDILRKSSLQYLQSYLS